MTPTKIYAATLVGVTPTLIEIEIDLSSGLPFFQIVGLPDAILKESRTRVKSAILQAGFSFPSDERLVLNLAPSKIRKEGSAFELALAARILLTSGQLPPPPYCQILFLGELALDGSVRATDEMKALALSSRLIDRNGMRAAVVLPSGTEALGLDSSAVDLFEINHLQDLCKLDFWKQKLDPTSFVRTNAIAHLSNSDFEKRFYSNFWAKHLLLASFGGLHYLVCGPPGCGKTFFAHSVRELRCFLRAKGFNPLAPQTQSAVTGAADIPDQTLDFLFQRAHGDVPWAAPHHSVTAAGLLGGGTGNGNPHPGAITRAHGGILFLDELLEFQPRVLDSLREPWERGHVELHRSGFSVTLPSKFQLIAATNPCRCGYFGAYGGGCRCSTHLRRQYQMALSGPFFDRFDVRIFADRMLDLALEVSGTEILARLEELVRFTENWSSDAEASFVGLIRKHRLSFRSAEKIRRLAGLIARIGFDVDSRNGRASRDSVNGRFVETRHISEALAYQSLPELTEPRVGSLGTGGGANTPLTALAE